MCIEVTRHVDIPEYLGWQVLKVTSRYLGGRHSSYYPIFAQDTPVPKGPEIRARDLYKYGKVVEFPLGYSPGFSILETRSDAFHLREWLDRHKDLGAKLVIARVKAREVYLEGTSTIEVEDASWDITLPVKIARYRTILRID